MCDVASVDIFCKESVECLILFPDSPPITDFSVASVSTVIFHISCISMLRFLYLSFFSASFHITLLSYSTATSIDKKDIPFFTLIIVSDICQNMSVHLPVPLGSKLLFYLPLHTLL